MHTNEGQAKRRNEVERDRLSDGERQKEVKERP